MIGIVSVVIFAVVKKEITDPINSLIQKMQKNDLKI